MIMTRDKIDDFNIRIKKMIGNFLYKNYSENIVKEISVGMHITAEKEFGMSLILKVPENFDATQPARADLLFKELSFNPETHGLTIDYYIADDNHIWHHFKITFESSLKELVDF